jgi:hypothetical protein
LINLNSCGIKKIVSEKEYYRLALEDINLENLGRGKILFYNGDYYCPTVECGWTTKINVHFDGISLGTINYNEYFIVELDDGDYDVELKHWDTVNMKSEHKISINGTTKIIKLSTTAFSNKIEIRNQLPIGFDNYSYVK